MPPEPPSWDRKDLVFRDRKHEKGPGSLRRPRWRDAYHGPRDFPRSSPRRPPPGQYRQGSGYHQLYPEDSGDGHGCTPTRPSERYWPEDKGFRSSSERYGGRSRSVGSVGRENRGSFRRSPYWDSGGFSRQQQQQHHDSPHPPPPNYRQGTGYHQLYPEDSDDGHGCTPPRPADRCWPEGRSFRPSYGRYGSGSRSTCTVGRESRGSFRRSPNWDTRQQHHEAPLPLPVTGLRSVAVPIASPPPAKDHHDSSPAPGDGGGNDEATTGQRTDPDQSLALMPWKPHKWNRSCSLSLSEAVRSEPDESVAEVTVPSGVPSEKETPVRSPEELAPADEALSRKKQRLGWGEGLAKYERKKDGSEDVCGKSGCLVQCSNIVKSVGSDTSPKILGLSGSASPMTPTSLAYSSSPGMDKLANADNHTSHYGDPSCLESQTYSEEYILNSLLADLLQPEDAYSGDSSCSRHAAMSKLLLLKDNISKELEKTENDIDLLEGDLKALKCGEDIDLYTSPFAAQADKEPCQEKADDTSEVCLSKNHMFSSSAVMVAGEPISHNVESDKDLKEVEGAHGYCPETGSSEVDKAASPLKGVCDSDTQNWSSHSISVGTATSECTKTITLGHKEEQILICDPDDKALQAGSIDADVNIVGSSYSKNFSSLIDLIMASNRDAAKSASQVFDRFKPIDPARCDIWELGKTSCQRSCDAQIKEKLAKRKSFLKFKEQVLAIRYRVAHNMWREDLRLLSLRKQRKKSQKRFDLSNRLLLSGSQKHRSSLRSRFLSSAGKPTLIPTTEMINFVSKMLSESQIKIYRNSLKMPACILFEERRLGFTTNNGLIEDPVSFEKERTMINPWTEEEKELFMDMLSTFGKDFTKISSFLKHKTAADCIEFYYKNHKSESFRKVKRSLNLKKQLGPLPTNTYLVASGEKWKREANSTSLNMLETAAVIPVRSSGVASVKQLCNRRHVSGSYHEIESSQNGPSERTHSPGVPWHVRETAAANVLAGICGAVSSEAMSSCVTSCIDPAEKVSYRRTDHLLTSEVTQTIDEEETCSGEGCAELDFVDWNDEEKSSFIGALSLYGKDFARISLCVRSRSSEQCKIFFSKARKCLGLDVIHREPECGGTPASDTNGGRSDTEDANVVEMDSGICSTQSCSKSDTNVTQVMSHTIADGFGHIGKSLVQIQTERSSDNYDVGVLNEDEVETKVDKVSLESNEGKSESEVENLQSCAIQNNGGDTTLKCNGFVLPKVSNPLGNRELKKELESPGISLVKPSISEGMEPEHLNCQTSARVIQNQTGDCFPAEQSLEVDVHQLIIPKTELENGQEMKIETDSNANGSHPISSHNCQHLPSDLLSYGQKKSVSVNQEDPISNSVLPDSSSICFGDHHRAFSGLTFDFEKHGIKHPSSLSNDLYQHCRLGNTVLNQPLHVLRGYPLQVLDREMLKDSNLVSPVSVETKLKKNGISDQTQFPIFDSHPERCNDCRVSSSRSDLLFSSRSEELSNAQLRPYSQNTCLENEVQSNQSGDVKLFGKILRHPSSLQKSNSYSQGNNSKLPCPKQSRSSTMKGDILTETAVAATVPESSNHLAAEDVHLRSCGFWDGNIIQTGLSKLPESAIFLAKCQGSVGGVPSYSSKDVLPCSDGVLTGYQQAYMQELHKRNGFELVSGSQQQSRAARLGMNLVGGGAIMVGGGGVSCTGVTDPVAALKMHYAARAKILGEVDSWRGDVGGR